MKENKKVGGKTLQRNDQKLMQKEIIYISCISNVIIVDKY